MSSREGLLAGRVALVAGGAGGIGSGISRCLAAAGARVVIADINEVTGRQQVQAIQVGGGQAAFKRLDVGDAAMVNELTDRVARRYDQIDILVYAAAVLPIRSLIETDDQEWDHTMHINLFGAFFLARAAARYMIPRRYGKIINIASELTPAQLAGTYSISKWGLVGLTQNLALELAPHRINVNAVAPGTTPTEMWKQAMIVKSELLGLSLEEFSQAADASIPWGRKGTPEDVGQTVVFLASDNAEYITGELLHVSGGQRGPGTQSSKVKQSES